PVDARLDVAFHVGQAVSREERASTMTTQVDQVDPHRGSHGRGDLVLTVRSRDEAVRAKIVGRIRTVDIGADVRIRTDRETASGEIVREVRRRSERGELVVARNTDVVVV